MKKKSYRKLILLFLCMLAGAYLFSVPAHAAGGKATKVKATRIHGQSTEYMMIRGINAKKKTVWKYKTKTCPATQLTQTKCVVRKNRVYIFEGSTLRVVKKSNGKKLWIRKNITLAGHMLTFDSKNNLYIIGYYEDTVYKISSKGKILWQTDISETGNIWPYKLKCKNNKLVIYFENNEKNWDSSGNHVVKLSKKTGKLLNY